jgi:hypothetical protein
VIERTLFLALRHLSTSLEIFLVGDMLQPIHDFTVEPFLDGDVGHGRRRGRAMPVLFTGRKPDDITRMDVQNGPTFQLHPPRARCVCHAVRAPGSKVTLAPDTSAGAGA